MDYALLGWAEAGPTLDLDHRRFSYAGKFVVSNTGKAVARDGEAVVGAVAFNEDRTDEATLWLRYVTVREDYRGEGVGPPLLAFTADRAADRGYERVRIAVNNPFAYQAAYKAGFGYTGEQTGIAELVCQRPADRSRERYQTGLDRFRERELTDDEEAFLSGKADAEPPPVVESP